MNKSSTEEKEKQGNTDTSQTEEKAPEVSDIGDTVENEHEGGVETEVPEGEGIQEIEDISEAEDLPEDKSENDDGKDKIQAELSELKDKYLRLYSEYENYRRRTSRERLDLVLTANEELILRLLPVIDDFERALQSFSKEAGKDIKVVKDGINLISQKFQTVLNQQGLKEMNTKKGVAFDAELHDAISQMPATKKKMKGKVLDTVEKGYFIGDKVIRHAKVVIGS